MAENILTGTDFRERACGLLPAAPDGIPVRIEIWTGCDGTLRIGAVPGWLDGRRFFTGGGGMNEVS